MNVKPILILLGLVLALCSLPSQSAALQADTSIDTFWARFKAAVIKGDKLSVSAMTQFPVEMPYGMSPVRTKQQLLKRYRTGSSTARLMPRSVLLTRSRKQTLPVRRNS
jgi:hypothetical protein